MKIRSYNNELKILMGLFSSVFNNIIIDRRSTQPGNKVSDVFKKFKVPIVYGQRSRILKAMESRNENIELPMISFMSNTITRDQSRLHSLNDFVMKQIDGHTFDPSKIQPQPINIEIEMSIMTKYIEDCDQIIGNFIPFFSPTVYVAWPHPGLNANIKVPIIWNGSISKNEFSDVSKNQHYNVLARTGFEMRGWLFAGINTEPVPEGPLIKTVNKVPGLFVVGDSGFMMDNYYDVPTRMSFDEFVDNVMNGYVVADPGPDNRKNWDNVPYPQFPIKEE